MRPNRDYGFLHHRIAFTGHHPLRKYIPGFISQAGGKFSYVVTDKVDVLGVGSKHHSKLSLYSHTKLVQAQKKNIPIVDSLQELFGPQGYKHF